MNKLLKLFITFSLILTTQGFSPIILDVYAANVPSTNLVTACGDNKYSVDKIVGYDNFQNIACYSETEFSVAYQKMLDNAPNTVIRHNSSESPLNIVAADRAIAYSMNDTYLQQDTLIIYADQNLTTQYTYINQANSLYYYDTYVVGTGSNVKPSNLSVLIEVNGAKGYVSLKGIDIIPMIYVENRIDQTVAEPNKDTSNSWYVAYQTRKSDGTFSSQSIRPNISYYIVAPISNSLLPKSPSCSTSNGDLVLYTDTATSSFCRSVGKAPAWMPAGKYFSTNGIDFYHDIDLTNPVLEDGVPGKYFNYFSYLPLRSKTNYTSTELNNFLKSVLTSTTEQEKSVIFGNEQLFIDAQNSNGMNALLILAMGIQESNYGRSTYAQLPANLKGTVVYNSDTGALIPNTTVAQFCTQYPNGKYKDEEGLIRYCLGRNNIFGYAAYDSDPNNAAAFASLEVGIKEHMGRNLRFYLDAMNNNHYSSSIGNKGVGINTRYASDPWWSVKIASIAYQIDKYLGSKDYDYYQLGILKNDVSRDFYSDYTLGTKIYSINQKASTYTVLINEQSGDKYKIQSTNPIDNTSSIIVSPAGPNMKPVNWTPTLQYKYSNITEPYDWNTSFEYIDSLNIELINVSKKPITIVKTTDDLLSRIEDFKWNDDGTVHIKGLSVLNNTSMPFVETTTHSLIFINLYTSEEFIFDLTVLPTEYNNYNGKTYKSVGFESNLDLNEIPVGSYLIKLKTTSNGVTGLTNFSDPSINPFILENKITDGVLERFVFDSWNFMTYHYIKQNNLESFTVSPKLPTKYMSFAKIQTFTVNETQGLVFKGVSYINGSNMGQDDIKSGKIILINFDDLTQIPLTYDVQFSTGAYDPSIQEYNYQYAWFENITPIDLTTLPSGNYKVHIYINSNGIEDIAEIRDFSFSGNVDITEFRNTKLNINNVERRDVYLKIE